jgi:hypothetical protein
VVTHRRLVGWGADRAKANSLPQKGRYTLRKSLGLFALALIVAVPTTVRATSGAAALQYYVGTWSCEAGSVGQPPSKATAIYTLDSGLLHEAVTVPAQAKMTKPYTLSIATSYDAKKGRYVQTATDNNGAWWVSSAQPWTGNTEVWTDQANSANKLGRGQTIRTSANSFSFTGYPSASATKPDFKGTCTRSQ